MMIHPLPKQDDEGRAIVYRGLLFFGGLLLTDLVRAPKLVLVAHDWTGRLSNNSWGKQ